ncbi:MAG TPA: excinuclease ABC subunit UvrA, partial [Firmicutes bacterium]|nr:excinuclease ABC subunit UvrA [Bacillota bacterium]
EYTRLLEEMRRRGFVRARVDGQIHELEEQISLDKKKKHSIEVVIDRLVIREGIQTRLADSLETTLKLGEGLALVQELGGEEHLFSERFSCPLCGFSFEEISPRAFSFNSPYGACPECSGLGISAEFSPELIVPYPELTIAEGAIHPWKGNSLYYQQFLEAAAAAFGIDLNIPFSDLNDEQKDILFHGSDQPVNFRYENRFGRVRHYRRPFPGIFKLLERRLESTGSEEVRQDLTRYQVNRPCPGCGGRRLKESSLSVLVGGYNISQVAALTVVEAEQLLSNLSLTGREQQIADQVIKEIRARLQFLINVGLSYLSLDRPSATLSGGEAQRIRLATQIGSGLTGVIYILDEPSIGLHLRDNARLLDTLQALRDLGNTVIVVEHDQGTILRADHIVDIGPGAGARGGDIVAQGTVEEIMNTPGSITGDYLAGRRSIPLPDQRKTPNERWLWIRGAREHNLKNIDIGIPLGLFVCVSGVSGSGKSTLVNQILARALSRHLYRSREQPGEHDRIEGLDHLDKVVVIDQAPIGRTPRSNPATYTGLFDGIRELYSQMVESRKRGYRPGRFSFNVKGGRCEACRGEGILRIEMHFLPDVYVPCEVCRGRRYNRETLEIQYRGKNIADVLGMTVAEAMELFAPFPKIMRRLQTLQDVGLGYIRLGQPATTLSGGEAQRVKLATELSRRSQGRTIYILDEPTTGLHLEDINKLLIILDRLTGAGNTVLVIEHNLDVLKRADYLIDLGPEGGEEGGQVVAQGTPEQVALAEGSYTGQWLKRVLAETGPPGQELERQLLKQGGRI